MESFEKTLELFLEGNSLPEIAFKRKLAFSTIENHLNILVGKNLVKIEELVSIEKIGFIKKAVPENPLTLTEIKEKLPKSVSFGEIKWVLTSMGKFKEKIQRFKTDGTIAITANILNTNQNNVIEVLEKI